MKWLIFITLLFVQTAWARNTQTYDLGNGLIITQEQLDALRAAFQQTEADKYYYHWADANRIWRWIKQGHIDAGEMDFLTKPSGSKQNYGGGLYMADTPLGSDSYGTVAVAVKIPRGTPIYDDKAAEKILGHYLTDQQQSELGRYLPLLRKVTSDWVVVTNPSLTQDVSYAGRFGALAKSNTGSMNLQSIISQLAQEDPQRYGYLESLSHLMNYQDGVSFARSVRANPNNPWAEFDPHTFEDFKNTERQLFTEAAHGQNFGIAQKDGAYGAKLTSAETWADSYMKTLEEVHNSVLGTPNSDFRTGPVVGSGDGSTSAGGQDYLEVTEPQYMELKKNPYLDIELVGEQQGKKMVRIRYPDALRDYQRFKDTLSPDLYNALEAASHAVIGPAERATLNQKFIRELVKKRLIEAYGDGVDSRLVRDLISIHPYQDANGRSLRLMQRLGASDAGQEIPYFTMSDLDLMTSTKLQNDLLDKSGKVYEKWLADMLAEVQAAKREGRVPRLLQYPHEERVAETLSPISANPTWTHEDLEDIRKRDWAKLLEKWVGPNWQTFYDADLGDILKNPQDYMKNLTKAEFERTVQKLLKTQFEKDGWNIPYTMRNADRATFPTWLRAVNSLPDLSSAPEMGEAWTRFKSFNFTPQELPESEKLDFASKIVGQVNVFKGLSDAEAAKLIEGLSKQKDAEEVLRRVSYVLNKNRANNDVHIGPETAKAIDDLFAGYSCADAKLCRGHVQLWQTLSAEDKLGPHSLQFLQKDIAVFPKDDLTTLFFRIPKTPKDAYQAAVKRAAVQGGLQAFKKDPTGVMSQVTAFFDTLDPRDLTSRDLVKLTRGLKLSPNADTTGLEERLLKTNFTPDELKLIENRIHRVNMGKAPVDKVYYALLRTLIHHKPDSPLLDEALNTVWKGKDPKDFLKVAKIWTPGLQKMFEQNPDTFKGMSKDVAEAISRLKDPPPGIDKVMTWALNSHVDNAANLVKVAARLSPEQTADFDNTLASRFLSRKTDPALVDYIKTRPRTANWLATQLENGKLPTSNFGDISDMVKDRPKALAKLFDAATGSANKASPEELTQIWNNLKAHPDQVTAERTQKFMSSAASEDEMFDYLIKNPKALKSWFNTAAYNLDAKKKAILERMVTMDKPPLALRGLLLAEMHNGDLGDRILNLLSAQDSLKPWQRDLFKQFLSVTRDKTKWSLGWDIGNNTIKTGARREMAALYLLKRGFVNPKNDVLGQMEIYDLLKGAGISPGNFAKGDKNAAIGLAKAAMAHGFSSNGIGAMKDNYSQWQNFRDAIVKESSLSPTQESAIHRSIGRNRAKYGEQSPDEDLIKNLIRKHGAISDSTLKRWTETGSCSLAVTQFFRKIKATVFP